MCGHGRLGCSTSQVSRKKDISPGSSINTTSSSAIYTLSLHDALPIYSTSVSVWADWWGFKEEAMDGIHENAALNQQRSEEHTSELQSHSDLVCRLLLEKKKHPRFQSILTSIGSSTGLEWLRGRLPRRL